VRFSSAAVVVKGAGVMANGQALRSGAARQPRALLPPRLFIVDTGGEIRSLTSDGSSATLSTVLE
jgi:hypothetical protein